MKFTELTEEEFILFYENHPLKTFLQSKEIGDLRKKSGYNVNYVGVKKDKKVLCATMLTSIIKHFGKREFYSPRGFLIDFNDKDLLDFFVKNIKEYIKQRKGYILRIDPYVVNKERDIDGNVVKYGVDNTNIINNLRKLGFVPIDEKKYEQVSWMFVLDTEGKTEQQILDEMKPNTRNTIRKVEKENITIRELTYDELPLFQDIMEKTGERKNFSIRKLSYYQNMYNLFHDKNQIKYVVSELNLKKYIEELEKTKLEKKVKLDNLKDAEYNNGKKEALKNEIKSIEERIIDSKTTIKEENKEKVILSGSMFIMIKPEVIYLSSGNYDKYLKYKSQYLIQWEMIKYAINNGFKRYNFYGIPAHINEHPENYGIYDFKRGFNGYVEELIGEYALPIDKSYYMFKIISKLKN